MSAHVFVLVFSSFYCILVLYNGKLKLEGYFIVSILCLIYVDYIDSFVRNKLY